MATVSRTILVPAALVTAARNLGACLTPAAAGMFITPLSATGSNPPTWYVSSGMIDAGFATLMTDSKLLYSQAQQGATAQGLTLTATQTDADNLVAQSVVVDIATEGPFDTFARLGLQIVNPPV